jgi:multiple sugar transport system permease protein
VDVSTREIEASPLITDLLVGQAPTGNRAQRWLPYLLAAPALILMIGILYPFFTGMYWSLTDYTLISPTDKQWVGLTNYWMLLQSADFWNALRITLMYAVICLVVELPLGLGVAMVLVKEFPSVRIFRAVLIMPLMMPPVVGALMWKVMMASDGILNYLLSLVHVPGIDWMGSLQWSLWSIMLIDVWIYTPFAALILLAGLQSLPKEPFEASQVDGASAWFVFRRLTLPLIAPYVILVTVFRGVDSLKIFDLIYATTQGGPVNATMTLQIQSFYTGIRWTYFGEGMSYLIVLWLMCYGITFYLTRAWTKSIQRATGL